MNQSGSVTRMIGMPMATRATIETRIVGFDPSASSAQAASRTLMGRLAPAGGEAEAYGLYGLTGRATGFLGPWLFAGATAAFASQRAGMATVIALFALGGLIVATVREPARGR